MRWRLHDAWPERMSNVLESRLLGLLIGISGIACDIVLPPGSFQSKGVIVGSRSEISPLYYEGA